LVIKQDEIPRSFTSAVHKRHDNDDEFTYSNKRHVVTERIIPVDHQRATVVHEEKPTVGKTKFFFGSLFFDFSFHQNHHLNV